MRIQDPDELWVTFQAHLQECSLCTIHGECPEGVQLRDAWGDAESKWARLQADILNTEFPESGDLYLPDYGERTP